MEPVSETVSVVMVNYNGEAFLEECLRSILDQSRCPDEILIVDNASTDRSLSLLQTSFPDIPLLKLQENLGYAGACNRGIEASTGELVAILNNDLVLDSRWLESLLKENSPAWDFWASRILFASDPSRVDSAGDGMAVVGQPLRNGLRGLWCLWRCRPLSTLSPGSGRWIRPRLFSDLRGRRSQLQSSAPGLSLPVRPRRGGSTPRKRKYREP